VGDKWTLLIIRDLAAGPRRFVELQRVLPGISTEQLRSRLNRMVADDLLSRKRYREVPPRVDYELTERAAELLSVIGALSRWGSRWAWGGPENGEAIDIGAILRSLPGIEAPTDLEGVIELSVTCEAGELIYSLTTSGGRISIEERPAANAGARIRGPQSAWVASLSPSPETDSLEITGDAALARDFLALIAPGAFENASIA
jgi:DNA-binding HxlR family transcriptional regulator